MSGEQVEKLYNMATNGDASSNYKLGLKYYKTSDFGMAFEYFTKASNMGNRDAKYYLAGMYYAGRGTSKDINKACDLLKELAISGDKDSFEKLYSFAKSGKEQALQSLVELAKSNRSDIQFAFGEIYSGKEDFDKACAWYEQSARQENEEALQKLVELAKSGNEKALQKLVELAKNDNENALQRLEKLPQTYRSDIQFVIGEIYASKEDFDKACDWYEKSARQYNEKALQILVELAKNDKENALQSLEKLSQTHRSDIQFALGEIYSGKENFDKACDWYEKSARQGNKKALQKLAELANRGIEKANIVYNRRMERQRRTEEQRKIHQQQEINKRLYNSNQSSPVRYGRIKGYYVNERLEVCSVDEKMEPSEYKSDSFSPTGIFAQTFRENGKFGSYPLYDSDEEN